MKRIALLSASFLIPVMIYAQVPQTMNFQGILTDKATGNMVADGNYNFVFTLYDAPAGGNQVWSETHNNVPIVSGLYNVILGGVDTPLDTTFDKTYYLEVTVGSETLDPRVQLSASPYSFTSGRVVGTANIFPSSGNVGIGTNTPGANLSIYGSNADVSLEEMNESTASPSISFTHSRGTTSTADLIDNDRLGALFFRGQTGGAFRNIAGMSVYYKDLGNNYAGARTYFWSKDTTDTSRDRLVIDENGNVGIGTSDLPSKLTINGNLDLLDKAWMNHWSDDDIGSELVLAKSRGSDKSSQSSVLQSDNLGIISFTGHVGSDQWLNSVKIKASAIEDFSVGGNGSMLDFQVTPPGSSVPVSMMSITGGGDIRMNNNLAIKRSGYGSLVWTQSASDNPDDHSMLWLVRGRGDENSPQPVLLNDPIGSINFLGVTGGAGGVGASIVGYADEDFAVSRYGMRLEFSTTLNGGVLTPRMTILNNGNIGIGETNPLNTLHVNAGNGNALFFPIRIENDDVTDTGGSAVGMLFDNAPGKGAIAYERLSGWGKGSFHFLQNTVEDGSEPTLADAVMSITNNGKVGIGTTTPEGQLHLKTPGGNVLNYPIKISHPDYTDTGGSAAGILFDIEGATDESGKGAMVYERQTGGYGKGSFHFLQSTSNDFSLPALSDAVMTITNDGKVGIGTTTPINKLTVEGGNGRIQGGGSTRLEIRGYTDTPAEPGSILFLERLRGPDFTNRLPVASGDVLGSIEFRGYDGNKISTGASIRAQASQDFSSSGIGTILDFQVAPNDSTAPVSMMTIYGGGDIRMNHNLAIKQDRNSVIWNQTYSNEPGWQGQPLLWFLRGKGQENNPQPVTLDDPLGSVFFMGQAVSKGGFGASITAVADQDFTDTQNGSRLEFSTTPIDGIDLATRMTILNNGNVGIGATDPTELLDVNGNARIRSVGSGTGVSTLYVTSDGTLSTSTSDIRLKTNITDIHGALDKVMRLQGHYFNWKSKPNEPRKVGLIAQEVEKIIPEIVFTNPADGYMGVQYPEISAVLIEAIKDQQRIIDSQKAQIQSMEERLAKLEQLLGTTSVDASGK